MGIFRRGFPLISGMVFGMYVAQNYNIPNLMKIANTGIIMAKRLEEAYRKPKKFDDDE